MSPDLHYALDILYFTLFLELFYAYLLPTFSTFIVVFEAQKFLLTDELNVISKPQGK